jgi:hypothetical protein
VRNSQREFDEQMEHKVLQQQENPPSDRNSNLQRRRSSTAPAGRIESDPKGVADGHLVPAMKKKYLNTVTAHEAAEDVSQSDIRNSCNTILFSTAVGNVVKFYAN